MAQPFLVLLIFFALLGCSICVTKAQENDASEWKSLRKSIEDVRGQEREILQNLFLLQRSADEARSRMEKLRSQAQRTKWELAEAEQRLSRHQREYLDGRDRAAKLLRLIQQMGPTSYVEVLVGASNWGDFLARLDTVVLVVRNTMKALAQLNAERGELIRQREVLVHKTWELNLLMDEIERESIELTGAIRERERVLGALGQRRTFYQHKLDQLERSWMELAKPFARRLMDAFSVIPSRLLLLEGVSVIRSQRGWRITVPESSLNSILQSPEPSGITLRLHPEEARFTAPDGILSVSGKFRLDDQGGIEYLIENVEFAGIPLHSGSILELFGRDRLMVNMIPWFGNYEITSLEMSEGELELFVSTRSQGR